MSASAQIHSQQNPPSAVARIRAGRPIDLYRDHRSGITEAEFRARCQSQAIWHSVDLGDVFIEGKRKTSEVLAREAERLHWPDVRDKSVLDIGAFGGWYSFEAERRGAASVTAIDYYSWAWDWRKLGAWMESRQALGEVPVPYDCPPEILDTVNQPGRACFDVTKAALRSNVTPILTTVEEFDSPPFDLVLFLGVLYHAKDPLGCLTKVAALTKEHVIVETLGLVTPGQENRAIWEFYGDDSVNSDPTTWWAPNGKALLDVLIAAGFSRAEIKYGVENLGESERAQPHNIRLWAHAWK